MRIAREGRPGPVHLSLPVDLLEARLPDEGSDARARASAAIPVAEPGDALVEAVARELDGARAPLILCGPLACGPAGRPLMVALEEAAGLPVLGMESPRGLNDPSLGAFAEILPRADCLVLVGKPLDFTLRFGEAPALAPDCRFVVLDPDPALAGRVDPARLAVSGRADALVTLAALARRLGRSPRPDWRAEVPCGGGLPPVRLGEPARDAGAPPPGGTLPGRGGLPRPASRRDPDLRRRRDRQMAAGPGAGAASPHQTASRAPSAPRCPSPSRPAS